MDGIPFFFLFRRMILFDEVGAFVESSDIPSFFFLKKRLTFVACGEEERSPFFFFFSPMAPVSEGEVVSLFAGTPLFLPFLSSPLTPFALIFRVLSFTIVGFRSI